MTTAHQSLSVIMPVFNELRTAEQAITEVLATDFPVPHELILVDDGSTDGTRELLRSRDWGEHVTLIEHDSNQGKGAAVLTGLQRASGQFSAIFDADLEYEPSDIGRLLPFVLDGQTQACFGARAFDGYSSHSFRYVMGNRAVTLAFDITFDVYLRDIMTCHKVIDTELFKSLDLRERGFAIEAEISARLVQRGVRVFEVPIRYHARSFEEGKKITPVDGLRCLRTIARCKLTPDRG